MVFLPLVGALVMMLIPKAEEELHKTLALITSVAVAVVGGKRWAARHWAELIWVDLDYQELAAAGAKYLLGAQGASVPQVQPRYERWVPRKPAASASDADQETWRPVIAC